MALKFSCLLALLMLLNNILAQQMIYTCSDLQNINNNLAINYALANDIDCSATVGWNAGAGFLPIGMNSPYFSGTFDGRNLMIYNLTINRPSTNSVGLFGVSGTSAIIMQVGLESVNIRGNQYIGGLVGDNEGSITNCYTTGSVSGSSTFVGGLVGDNEGSITNCYSAVSTSGLAYVGGLVGIGGTITNCYATGNVFGQGGLGGLVGWASVISKSYATGSVSGSGSSDLIGGLVGVTGGTITDCYATGSVSGSSSSSQIGGLVGSNGGGSITNSYATGNVFGPGSSNQIGGLVGSSVGTITNCYTTGNLSGSGFQVGGLVGNNAGTIINSYAIGSVMGSSSLGGLVGTGTGAAYSSYWNIQTSGQTLSAGGMGKNTLALYHNTTYLGWDFTCVWSIDEGQNTPQLTLNNCGPSPQIQMQVSNCYELQLAVFLYTAEISLTQDIDCTETATWNNGAGFYSGMLTSGSFNGFGHRIINLMINRTSVNYMGLFGQTSSTTQISNVILEQSIIFGASYVGSLVGSNQGTITQCNANGIVWGSGSYVGGLMGYNRLATISSSYAIGSISGISYVGGLLGYNGGAIFLCYTTGDVSGSNYVGGLAGMNAITYSGVTSSITNSFATGSVLGSSDVGGLVGYNGGTITQSYATGNVSGSSNVGGLIGYNSGTTIFVYWDTQTSTQVYSAGGVGLPSTAMQQADSFVGWNFRTTWTINPGVSYPLLQVFILPPILSNTLSNITCYVGTLFQFAIPTNTFIDPNGLLLTYSAGLQGGSPLPSWLLFKSATQTFAGTPLSGAQGTFSIVVSVYNIPTQTVSDLWQLTIPDRPPILNAPLTQQIAFNGQTFQFVIPEATFFDPDGDRLQLTATSINYAALPSWLGFNAALGIFSGTATKRGTVSINVTANDGYGGQVSALLTIATPNTAPQTTGTFPNQVVVIAQPFSFTVPANLFFDLDGDPLAYSAGLFGGGQLLPWLNFNAQTLTFQGTPDSIGFLVISLIATDPYNATASLDFGISVSALSGNAPPLLAIQMLDQTATVSEPFTLTLPKNMFIDANGNPLTYSATLEGGAPLPSWLNFSTTSLIFSGVAPTTGSLHITVRANDGGGGFALDTFALTITTNQNLPPLLQNPISNQEVAVGGNYQFIIPSNTFIDVNNGVLTYSAATSSGGQLPHWLHFNSDTRTFAGTPRDTDTNIYSARITTVEVHASNGIGSALTSFQLSVTGTSQAARIISVLITLASIASTAFALYRNRARLWNAFYKKKYEKEPKQASLNEAFTYRFTVTSKQVMHLRAFSQAQPKPSQKKSCGCFTGFSVHRYQELVDHNYLPDWLQFNRNGMTLSGTPTEFADLYICAVGYDGRYLEAFKLRCGQPQGKDVEMHNI